MFKKTNCDTIVEKFTNEVFLVPTLAHWGGLMTNFFFSPDTISGLALLIVLNTLSSSCSGDFILFPAFFFNLSKFKVFPNLLKFIKSNAST